MAISYSSPEGNALSANPHGVGSVFDVRSIDVLVIQGQDRSAHAKLGIRAIGRGLRSRGAGSQSMELPCCDPVRLAGLSNVRFIGAREEIDVGHVGEVIRGDTV